MLVMKKGDESSSLLLLPFEDRKENGRFTLPLWPFARFQHASHTNFSMLNRLMAEALRPVRHSGEKIKTAWLRWLLTRGAMKRGRTSQLNAVNPPFRVNSPINSAVNDCTGRLPRHINQVEYNFRAISQDGSTRSINHNSISTVNTGRGKCMS